MYISGIPQFEIYPFLNTGSSGSVGYPGFCILGTFEMDAATSFTFRRAPYSTIDNPQWVFFNGTPFSNVQLSTNSYSPIYSVDIGTNVNYQPGTEYIVQFLEIGSDGQYHIITPSNQTDDVKTMCTPNTDGTLSSSCPYNVPVITGQCNTASVNQALQNNGTGVSIQNIMPGQNNVSFTLSTQNIQAGLPLFVLYTTNVNHITNGDFSNATVLPYTSSSQGSVNVNISNLQANTTYYVTVLNGTNSIIINTSGNQPYETFSTNTNNNGGSSAGGPSTININLGDTTFGQSELSGENIEEGFTQCGYGETYDCDFNQLLATIDRIIKFMIYIIVLPLAAILFAWSGIKLIIAREKSKAGAMSDAKAMFGRVFLGLVFALGAWVIVKFILVILGYTDASGLLTQILGIATTQ